MVPTPSASVAPAVLDAVAVIRGALRVAPTAQKALLYHVLMGLAGEALYGLLPLASLGRSTEPSQAPGPSARHSERVHDQWLSPKEGAARLGISVRTLVRRSESPPYDAFCIPQPRRGFKVSEQGLAEYMRRARH